MFSDQRFDNTHAQRLQHLERAFLIGSNETGIADNVSGKYGGEAALQTYAPFADRLSIH
jgi:hypothetical protein